MRRLPALYVGLLALLAPGAAWWPFGGDEGDRNPEAPEHDGPHFAFGRVPGVVVVDNHFGSDPWEDMHRNMHRVMKQSSLPMLPGGNGQALMRPPALEMQLGGILSAFGDQHAGHFGRTGSFQVDDDHHSRFRITAQLPGYKFGGEAGGPGSESPLSVRAVGRRSLVVSGTQQSGPIITTWQRSFVVPKGCNISSVSVTYSSASGNLTVEVPRLNQTEAEGGEEEDDSSSDEEGFNPMLPPALRAMQEGLPAILGQLGPARARMGQKSGFLMPAHQGLPGMLEEVFGMMGQMHPRYHPPPGGENPVPEDAVVNLVGCFAESQLDKVELKYYGETNAASFTAMYWHARSDHVPYFAMSRHEAPLGHAFTAHGFVHEVEKPQWGVYDGCGSQCDDDPNRWCGCANEGDRGLGNRACPSEGEKRFAVYKIGEATRPEVEEGSNTSQDGSTGSQAERPGVLAQGRPYWQLSGNENDTEAPAIEIVVPKGTIAKAQGREVLLYNATDPEAASHGLGPEKAAAGSASAVAADAGGQEAAASEPSGTASTPSSGAADGSAAAAPSGPPPTATPVGKMRLPVGVSPDACSWDHGRTADDGGQVIKCQLDQRDVKSVPIKVIDEL